MSSWGLWGLHTAGGDEYSLDDENRISVAEQVMERSGLAGRMFYVPNANKAQAHERGYYDQYGNPDVRRLQREHSAEAEEFVNGILQQHGHDGDVRVMPNDWNLRQPGSGQAYTDGNKIALAGQHTNALTLLHETAHILTNTEHRDGHGPLFQKTLHGLYHQHLGPEAAETFAGVMDLPDHHTASTDGIRYAHVVEADVAEDLRRMAAALPPIKENQVLALADLLTPHHTMTAVLDDYDNLGYRSETPDAPILARVRPDIPGKYEIADGHHRVADAIRNGITHVVADIDPVEDDEPYEPPFYDFGQHMGDRAALTPPRVPAAARPKNWNRFAVTADGEQWVNHEDLHRLAMPSRDAYDEMVMGKNRKTDDVPEQGEFFHGSNYEHQPGDILESVRARGDPVGRPGQLHQAGLHERRRVAGQSADVPGGYPVDPRNARLAMAWDQWAPQVQGGCEHGCDHSRMTMGEYSIQHPFGRSALQFTHDTAPDGTPELYISGVHTNEGHRRSGVAEALMRRLHDDHPGTRINPGYMTDMGQGLKDGLVGRIPGVKDVLAGKNGPLPPLTFEPFNTMWSNGIMARHAADGRPLAHLHWYPDGEIETIRVHPELRGRGIGKAILVHAATHPETYEASGGIKPSNHLTADGRAFARSMGHNPDDSEVTPAEGEHDWAWRAVDQYVPMHIPYTGQNEDEMSHHLEQPWTPPNQKTASADDGWPVWWRGRHRPGVEFDKRWHPNHPEHIPAPWEN